METRENAMVYNSYELPTNFAVFSNLAEGSIIVSFGDYDHTDGDGSFDAYMAGSDSFVELDLEDFRAFEKDPRKMGRYFLYPIINNAANDKHYRVDQLKENMETTSYVGVWAALGFAGIYVNGMLHTGKSKEKKN